MYVWEQETACFHPAVLTRYGYHVPLCGAIPTGFEQVAQLVEQSRVLGKKPCVNVTIDKKDR